MLKDSDIRILTSESFNIKILNSIAVYEIKFSYSTLK